MDTANTESRPAPLYGLILAGGASARMGEDKGALDYHGKPQVVHLCELLAPHCERVFVSVNAAQKGRPPYGGLSLIVDTQPNRGPAAGLLAAHDAHPGVAWLVTAADLPRLDAETLAALAAGRAPGSPATAFRHEDGTLEPLCAIWEPVALTLLAERVAGGDASPRRCLEAVATRIVTCPAPRVLRSVDTQRARNAILADK